MGKKIYQKPQLTSEAFVPQSYVAACEFLYSFDCDNNRYYIYRSYSIWSKQYSNYVGRDSNHSDIHYVENNSWFTGYLDKNGNGHYNSGEEAYYFQSNRQWHATTITPTKTDRKNNS